MSSDSSGNQNLFDDWKGRVAIKLSFNCSYNDCVNTKLKTFIFTLNLTQQKSKNPIYLGIVLDLEKSNSIQRSIICHGIVFLSNQMQIKRGNGNHSSTLSASPTKTIVPSLSVLTPYDLLTLQAFFLGQPERVCFPNNSALLFCVILSIFHNRIV